MTDLLKGQCLCGAVKFHGRIVEGRGINVCHCGQCRRWGGGGPFMPVRFEGGVSFDDDAALTWFRSSESGERGFCRVCGSSLFWRAPGAGNDVAINVSSLGDDHGLQLQQHIWVDDQPDWYTFADDTPRLTAAQCLGEE